MELTKWRVTQTQQARGFFNLCAAACPSSSCLLSRPSGCVTVYSSSEQRFSRHAVYFLVTKGSVVSFSFFWKCIIPVGPPVAADGNKHGKKVLGVSNGGECQNINSQNASEKWKNKLSFLWSLDVVWTNNNRLYRFGDPFFWEGGQSHVLYLSPIRQ